MATLKSVEIELEGTRDLALIGGDDSVWLVVPIRWWDLATLMFWAFVPKDRRSSVTLTIKDDPGVEKKVRFKAVRGRDALRAGERAMKTEYCVKCGRERPNYIADAACNSPIGGYCAWTTEVPVRHADERMIRERLVELKQTLEALAERAGVLFQTNGWIRTKDEPPPIGLRVLGAKFGDYAWYTRKDDGVWIIDSMNGNSSERPWAPEFWMVLPPTPEES